MNSSAWFRIVILAVAMGFSHVSRGSSIDEAEIKAMMERTVKAYAVRDLATVLALYRNDELMFFDLVPPAKDCCGYESAYKKTKAFFDGTVGPITAEWSDIAVKTDHDLAFATAFLHFSFTAKDGRKGDVRGRSTLVFRRIDDQWTCIHQHDSQPTEVVFKW
ncbi:MAG: SgcJ/EcaC family oxidoreductase [Steroidobacteraceae bacterium]